MYSIVLMLVLPPIKLVTTTKCVTTIKLKWAITTKWVTSTNHYQVGD